MLPPLAPFRHIGLRVFEPTNSSSGVNQWKNPLVHFNATSASFSLACRLPTQRMCQPHPSFERHLAEAFSPFSIFRIESPSFHSPFGKRLACVALPAKSHMPQGLATLSPCLKLPIPRKPLSAPNTLGLRPSELSSSPVIGRKVSLPLSAPALSYKTFTTLYRRFSGLLPPRKLGSF